MKQELKTYSVRLIGLITLLLFSTCSEEDGPALAKINTTSITGITGHSAQGGGEVINEGGAPVTERGIVWDTNSNPTILLSTKTSDGSGIGIFISAIGNLLPNTKYFIKAYATNSIGTAYGNEITFTTLVATLPSVSSLSVTNVTATAAKSGGQLISDGGLVLNSKGVVWSTSNNPTVSLTTKTNEGTESTNYSSRLFGLLPNKTYFMRAYATNDKGTGYGAEISFTTTSVISGPVTDIDGNIYQTVHQEGGLWRRR